LVILLFDKSISKIDLQFNKKSTFSILFLLKSNEKMALSSSQPIESIDLM
jgi:hypothetical protein